MEKKYNEEQKQRAYNWREKNRKKYNEISKKSYEKNKEEILKKLREKRAEIRRRRVFVIFQSIKSTEYYEVVGIFETLRNAQTYMRQNKIEGYITEMEVK